MVIKGGGRLPHVDNAMLCVHAADFSTEMVGTLHRLLFSETLRFRSAKLRKLHAMDHRYGYKSRI